MTTDIATLVGQRVLVSVADGEPQMTGVRALSPQGQYVWLSAASTMDQEIGWRHRSYVRVLQVFGASSQTAAQLANGIAQQGGVLAPALSTATT